MPRLFIADPSLKDLRGHHYMLTRAATLSAQSAGFDVVWLCSAKYEGALDQAGASVAPVFGASMYDAYMPQKNAGKPAWLGKLFRRAPPPPAAPATFHDDLRAAIARHGIGHADRILLHTADGDSLAAVARIALETPASDLPILHMATPYDPAGVMPNKTGVERFPDDLAKLRRDGKLDSKLFLYAENAYLAEHLSVLWQATVRPLPLPAAFPPEGVAKQAKAQLAAELGIAEDSFIVASLGSARLEKGFHLIPDIARRVFELANEDSGASKTIKFVLHASPQIIGRDPLIAKAIEALKARPTGQIHLLLDALSDGDYQRLLNAADVILMPYGEREYRVRGSAVVTEAIAAAKTIVAKPGTYPGLAAQAHGGLTGAAPIDMAKAILEIYRGRETFRIRALEEQARFTVENSIENYWRRCLEAEREGAA